jgi:hypothetical protein
MRSLGLPKVQKSTLSEATTVQAHWFPNFEEFKKVSARISFVLQYYLSF